MTMTVGLATDVGTNAAAGRAAGLPVHSAAGEGPVVAGRTRRRAPLPRSCTELLADAGRVLDEAMRAPTPAERFAAAHLAALRAAAAVLAARARPRRRARGSAWDLLPAVAPELGEWAQFFAAGSATRQSVDAGIWITVRQREADDMMRAAAEFIDVVGGVLDRHRGG